MSGTPTFNEKEFLLGLLSIVESEHKSELRFIMKHKFDYIDVSTSDHMPTLKKLSSDVRIKKFIMEWFKEAEERNFVSPLKPNHYEFTDFGYKASLAKKHPIKQFIKNNPKYTITTAVAFSLAIFTAIRLIKC